MILQFEVVRPHFKIPDESVLRDQAPRQQIRSLVGSESDNAVLKGKKGLLRRVL